MIRFLIRLVVIAAIIGLVARLVPGIHVYGSYWALLWLAVLFSFINAFVGPVLKLFSLPLILLTLGLFLLVVNAALLGLTAKFSSHLDIDSFGAAVWGGLLISVFSWLAERLLPISDKSEDRQQQRRGRPPLQGRHYN